MSVESTLLIIFTSLALLSLWTALSLICFSLLSGWWDGWSSQKYKYRDHRLTTSVKNRRKDHSRQPFYCAGFGSHQSCQIFEPKTAIMTPRKFLHPRSFWKSLLLREHSLVCMSHVWSDHSQLARIRFNSAYYVGICVDTSHVIVHLIKNQCSWLLALKLTEASSPSTEEDLPLSQSKVSLIFSR